MKRRVFYSMSVLMAMFLCASMIAVGQDTKDGDPSSQEEHGARTHVVPIEWKALEAGQELPPNVIVQGGLGGCSFDLGMEIVYIMEANETIYVSEGPGRLVVKDPGTDARYAVIPRDQDPEMHSVPSSESD